jgi:glycosyltransferase involved in cell wall biosynthesis
MAKDDSRIKLIQKANGGTASARKLGLEHAQGEYIQLLDADDQMDADKLLRQTTEMDASNLDVSYTDWCFITPSGEKEDIKGMDSSLIRILAFWGTFGTLPIHSFLYRRDFLEQHHINFTTAIKEREDWDFHIQIYSARPKIKRIEGYCGAAYMKSPTGKTTCGDLGKQRAGTLRFLAFEIKQQRGYKRLLLSLRLSVELCFLFLSTIKYRIWEQLQLLTIFKQSWFTRIEVILALLLSPVALGIIIVYLFYTRCFAK